MVKILVNSQELSLLARLVKSMGLYYPLESPNSAGQCL
jgi:hypothetical protein